MKKSILIIEDDPGIRLSLQDEFESLGFVVTVSGDGSSGLKLIKEKSPDLVILDLMLPMLNGYQVCSALRSEGNNVPIIILTVKDQEIDKVMGLELGADDYVTKPFSLRELTARVNALMRRSSVNKNDITTFKIGDTEFDISKYEAWKKGKAVEYTPLEFQMLQLLYSKKGNVVTRIEFLENVWADINTVVTERTVDSHIANIRKKLENNPLEPEYIISIRGVGYKLTDKP